MPELQGKGGIIIMKITLKVTGQWYDDNITAMLAAERLKTVLRDALDSRITVTRKTNIVTVVLPGDISEENGGVIGLKEAIAAEVELIANVEFVEVTA